MTTFHRRLPANGTGRDFIVGDLHGCLDLLQTKLTHIRFNTAQDRLFSVGDLADRGPDSMGCLRLLREPWFHAVRGNHEDMLLDFRYRAVMPHSSSKAASLFFRNGGGWIRELNAQAEAELAQDLLPRVAALPYVITVGEGQEPFHIVHAELMTGSVEEVSFGSTLAGVPVGHTASQVLTDELLTDKILSAMIEPLTWGRRLVGKANMQQSTELDTSAGRLLVSPQPMHPGLSLTYVGHTPTKHMVLHDSHLFIDRGAYTREPNTCLLVLNHNDVRAWLASKRSRPRF